MTLEAGMFAKAKAGHDKNCIYVIISVNDEYVYLADGGKRLVSCPKKKNRRHVQIIYKMQSASVSEDEMIRMTINEYVELQK